MDNDTADRYAEVCQSSEGADSKFESVTSTLAKIKVAGAKAWCADHEGQKVVLYTHLRETAKILGEALGVQAITGDIPAPERGQVIKASNGLVVATMHAIGIGINDLADFDAALFVELYWKSDVIEQAASRLRRLCQPRSATVDFLIGMNTIEEQMARVVISKLSCLTKSGLATSFGSDLKDSLHGRSDKEVLETLFSSDRNLEALTEGEL
jgi:SNF2 family DNA or RNA helicase